MIFFYNDELKNNIFYLTNQCDLLLNSVTYNYNSQINTRNLLIQCMDKITYKIEKLQDIDNTQVLFTLLNDIKDSFSRINYNIDRYKELKNSLKKLQSMLHENNNSDICSLIDSFNKTFLDSKEKIIDNNNSINNFLNNFITCCNFAFLDFKEVVNENVSTCNISEPEEVSSNTLDTSSILSNIDVSKQLTDNRTLLISEKQNTVYLPYLLTDVQDIYEKNKHKYIDLNDVINKNYILPLSRFKNPVVSRFKEAFSLLKYKEKAPLLECLDLALELSFNSSLNPAIITACRNLDELDIYLDYMDSNELDKFNIFEIIYEVAPLA